MKEDELSTPFARSLLTGLFAGITATLACFAFTVTYISFSGFPLSAFINVSSIIFACNLLLLACGIIYFYLRKAFRHGGTIFIVAFVLVTLFCLWKTTGIERSPVHEVSSQFRTLLSGVIIILGICAFFGIPFLYNNKSFRENVV